MCLKSWSRLISQLNQTKRHLTRNSSQVQNQVPLKRIEGKYFQLLSTPKCCIQSHLVRFQFNKVKLIQENQSKFRRCFKRHPAYTKSLKEVTKAVNSYQNVQAISHKLWQILKRIWQQTKCRMNWRLYRKSAKLTENNTNQAGKLIDSHGCHISTSV